MANRINFNIGFQIDKAGLNELQKALVQVQHQAQIASNKGTLTKELKEASQAASQLEDILNQAWNSKLNQLDLSKVNNSIKQTYGSVGELKRQMSQSGAIGTTAYNQVASAILNTNLQLKQSNKLLDEMATTMANTVKWGITSSIFNTISGSIQKAYGYTKNLDSSLNDIRIVTDKSAESMQKFAVQANNAAKGLGASTLDYTQASLIYYQQGLSDDESAARAETTLKAANVTGQTGAEVSEQLTAVWNGYKVTAEETELYVDKLAAVAATTAADLEELSTGMSKVASAANLMGVDMDQLNAQLATIVSVTRQAPESVGTALKTIYARMGDIEAGVDTETTLGNYTAEMEAMGFNVLDMNGNLRDMGEVIEEIGSKWSTMSREQQISLSQTMAGTRQYNNLLSLFDNWDMYTNALETSANAAGTLQKQQDIYMESTEAHLQQLSTEAERTYDILFDQEAVNELIDALNGGLKVLNSFLKGTGGGLNSLAVLGSMVANIFNKQIGKAIIKQIENMKILKRSASAEELKQNIINAHNINKDNISSNVVLDQEVQNAQALLNVKKALTTETYNELTQMQQQIAIEQQRLENINNYRNIAKELNIGLTEDDLKNDDLDKIKTKFEEAIQFKEQEIELNQEAIEAYNEGSKAAYDTDKQRLQVHDSLFKLTDKIRLNNKNNIDILSLENKITYDLELSNDEIKALQEAQNQLTKERNQELQKLRNGLQGVADAEAGVRTEIENSVNAMQQAFDEDVKVAEKQKNIQSLVQGFTALSTVVTSVIGMFKALGDETLTTEEKFAGLFTTIISNVPIVIQSLPALKDGFGTIVKLVAKLGLSVPQLLLILAAVAAAITAITVTIYGLVKAYNADADAAKKAKKTAEDLKNTYKELRQTYDELKTSVDNYIDSAKHLEDLIPGTKEYAEALNKVNEQALELINNNQELAQYAYRENGVIKISEEGLDAYLQEQEQLLRQSQSASLSSEVASIQAQQKSDRTNYNRQDDSINSFALTDEVYSKYEKLLENYTDEFGYFIGKSGESTAMESDEVGIFNLTDTQLDAILDYMIENNQSSVMIEDLQEIDELQGVANTLIARILESNDQLKELSEQRKIENKNIELLTAQLIHNNLIETNESYQDLKSNEQDAISTIISANMNSDEFQAAFDTNLAYIKDEYAGDGDKELHREYAKALGWSYANNHESDTEDGTGIFTDASGALKEISDEEMRRYLAEQKTIKEMYSEDSEEYAEVEKAVQKVSNLGQKFGSNVSTELLRFVNGSMDAQLDATKITFEQFTALKENFDNQGNFIGITDEEAQALGYSNAKEYSNAVKQALDEFDWEAYFNNAFNNIEIRVNLIADVKLKLAKGEVLSEEELANLKSQLGDTIDWELFDASSTIEQLELLADAYNKETDALIENYNKAQELSDLEKKEIEDQRKQRDELKKNEATLTEDEKAKLRELNQILEQYDGINLEITFSEVGLKVITNEVDNLITTAKGMQTAAELIGESFIVAAKDAEALYNIFPVLQNNAEVLADGNIKLNQEVVNAVLGGNADVIESNAKILEQDIINHRDAKQMELEANKNKIQLLTDYLEGKKTATELEDELEVEQTELESQLQQLLSQEEYEAMISSAENNQIVTDQVLTNLDKIGLRANSVSEAMNAAFTGKIANYEAGGATGIISIEDFQSQDYSNTDEEIQKLVQQHERQGSGDYARKVAAMREGLIDQNAILQDEINRYNLQISKLRSGITTSTEAMKNAASGLGGKTSSGNDRKEELKSIQEEIDRYWELNKTIEKVTDTIEKLNDEQSKLSGKELIASLKEENELLEQQAEAYKALADEQQREANELRGILSTYGVVFDAQGGVANYLAASQQALNYYNDAVVKYNSHIIDEATFNAAQSSYENFKSQLERYEALYYEEMKDTQDQLDELHTQQLENNLEQWEIGIQLQLDLSEAERNWNDFLQGINEDFKLTYADISQELSTLLANAQTFTNEEGTFETDIKALKDVMAEIDKFKLDEDSDMFNSMSEAQEKLKELIDTTQGDMSSLYDIFANAWNAYMEGIDQSADKFDDLMGQFENIENELDYQGKLIELIYGEEAYSLLDTLYKAQEKNNYVQIDALKQQRDMWHTLWKNAAEGTEEQTKYYELWTQAQEDLNNKVTDYIELLKIDYLNTIDDILKKLETNITGSSLDDLEEEWNRVTESSDKYLDNVESLYEVQTLANKISNSISETSSLKNQQKLQELYDKEIDYLREKENLTKYDLDAANARYEIALKEIALEEAQNSKNSMKLTRGTDGNWSYQYVADQDLVAEKQQDLTDAYKELYDLSKDAYEENLESLTDLQDKYLEAYREIIADETLAAEEKEQKIHELQSYYLEQYNLLAKENALYKDNLAISSSALLLNLYNQDKENFAAMTQEERELVQNLVDANANDFMTLESLILNNYDNIGNQATSVMSKVLDAWSTGAQQIADIWNADDGVSVKAQITEAQNNILDALDTYNYKVEEIAGIVEENFGPDGITGSIQDAEAATEDLEYAVSNLVDNTIDQLYDYRDALEDIEDMWYSVKDAIMEAIDAAREYANAEAIRKKQSAQTSGSLSSANTSGFVDLTPSGGGGGGNPGGKVCSKCGQSPCKCNSDTGPTVEVTLYSNPNKKSLSTKYIVSDKNKNNPPSKTYVYNEDDQLNYHQFAGGYINHRDRGKIKNTLGFDTGGYTGDWNGGDGKLAMLHSKELVLNAKDTSNILNAVEVIRDISNLSSSIESMIMDKLSAMILKLGNLNANRSYTSNVSQQDSIENNYYINAEFPNANDVNDIREALLSLSNVASQYRAENKK